METALTTARPWRAPHVLAPPTRQPNSAADDGQPRPTCTTASSVLLAKHADTVSEPPSATPAGSATAYTCLRNRPPAYGSSRSSLLSSVSGPAAHTLAGKSPAPDVSLSATRVSVSGAAAVPGTTTPRKASPNTPSSHWPGVRVAEGVPVREGEAEKL